MLRRLRRQYLRLRCSSHLRSDFRLCPPHLSVTPNLRMHHHKDGLSLQCLLSVLVFHLLLTPSCRGESQLIGPTRPIVATVGKDVILPCHLEPATDVVAMTLEWTRPDLDPIFVHVQRAGQDLIHSKHPSYVGRTSLDTAELKHGNISLKLSKVKLSDTGTYQCYIPTLKQRCSVDLVVASDVVSSPVIDLMGIEGNEAVVLQCESRGWYPEPELLWLDAEGNLLPAGPTETVPGPDGLYTVSGRATVEQRHSSSFTCRVRQSNTNQSRETHIQVADDFFRVQPSSSASPVTVFLVVILAVCIFLILLFGFFMWKRGQNQIKAMKGQWHKTNDGERKKVCKTDGQEDERELEQLVTHEPGQMEDVNEGEEGMKTKPVSPEPGPGFNDKDEKNRGKESGQRKDQVERSQAAPAPPSSSSSSSFFSSPFNWRIVSRQELQELEQEVATRTEQTDELTKNLQEEKQKSQNYSLQLDTRTKELQDEERRREKAQTEGDELKEEAERERGKLKEELEKTRTKLQDEERRRKKAETERDELKEELEKTRTEMNDIRQSADRKWTGTNDQLKQTQNEFEATRDELDQTKRLADELAAKVKTLTEEKHKSQRDCQQLQTRT